MNDLIGKDDYIISQNNRTRPFREVRNDMRNAPQVVVADGEPTAQMKVEIELLMKMKGVFIYWRPEGDWR